jgi:hypothetical protein
MDEKLTDELIEAILSPLEAAEARSLALVRALTESGLLREQQLQPFLDQADSASEIKGRGLRIRLKRVIGDIVKQAENARREQDENTRSQGKAGKIAEGPQQDPEEEAREHPKTDDRQKGATSASTDSSQNGKPADSSNIAENEASTEKENAA